MKDDILIIELSPEPDKKEGINCVRCGGQMTGGGLFCENCMAEAENNDE